jgi:cytochrome b561
MTARFPVRSRILHWLSAVLVFGALIIGFTMVNSIGSYAALVAVHMTIGTTILVITVVRFVNRRSAKPPSWPPTIGRLEGKIVTNSERLVYLLLVAQPLVGWAMVSATGEFPTVFGVALPRIAPFGDGLFFALRQTHSVLAYLLVIVIAAHVSGVLLHTIGLRDGILSRMTFGMRGRATPRSASYND